MLKQCNIHDILMKTKTVFVMYHTLKMLYWINHAVLMCWFWVMFLTVCAIAR